MPWTPIVPTISQYVLEDYWVFGYAEGDLNWSPVVPNQTPGYSQVVPSQSPNWTPIVP